MNIFFVAGPLHLICISEYVNQFKIKNYYIFYLKTSNKNIHRQILETHLFLGLKKMHSLNFSKFKMIKFFQIIKLCYFLYTNFLNYSKTFFLMDFRNSLMHFLRSIFINSEFVLIDDGTSTYMNFEKYISKKIYLPFNQYESFFGKINKLILFRGKFRTLLYKKIYIYSIYSFDMGFNRNCQNYLKFLKIKLSKLKKKFDQNLVFFSGTKLSERNAMSLSDELKLTIKINNYWKKKGKKMIYIAKRTSSLNKLEIFKKNNIETFSFDQPLEISLMTNKTFLLPKYFCSFGSTLDKTISIIYPQLNLYLIKFKNIRISKELEADLNLSHVMKKYVKNQKLINI